jgi:uncharacterized membrane protein
MSCCIAAPVIMMSQNRQEEKIGKEPKDYMINLKSELEIRMLHENWII